MLDTPRRFLVVVLIVPCLFLLAALLLLWPDFNDLDAVDWLPSPEPSQEAPPDADVEVITELEDPASGLEHAAAETAIERESFAPSERSLLLPSGIYLSGTVTDLVTGEPVGAFDFMLRRWTEEGAWIEIVHETVRDGEGRFSFPIEEEGRHYLGIRSSRHFEKRVKDLEISGGEGVSGLQIQLNPGASISGRIVEERTGRPVEDALIVPLDPDVVRYGTSQLTREMESILFGFPESAVHARSDAKGGFTLQGLLKKRLNLVAYHHDYAPGIVDVEPDTGDRVEIALSPGYCVYGRVLDDERRPLAGARITLSQPRELLVRKSRSRNRVQYSQSTKTLTAPPVRSGPDGRYHSFPFQPGKVMIIASAPGGSDAVARPFTSEIKHVEITDRNLEVNFGPVPEHVDWRGTLYGASGEPIPQANLSVRLTPSEKSDYGPTISRQASTGDLGAFEFRKLLVGQCKIHMRLPGMKSWVEWGEVDLDHTGSIQRDLHVKGAVIRGMIVDQWTGKVLDGKGYRVHAQQRSRSRSVRLYEASVTDEGRFSLEGLPPGNYTLVAQGPRRAVGQVKDLYLDEGQVLDDLSVVIPSRGSVKLKLVDFSTQDLKRLRVHVKGLYDESRGSFSSRRTQSGGVTEYTGYLNAGPWTAEVSIKNGGSWTWDFQVYPDQVTELEVYRNYLR